MVSLRGMFIGGILILMDGICFESGISGIINL